MYDKRPPPPALRARPRLIATPYSNDGQQTNDDDYTDDDDGILFRLAPPPRPPPGWLEYISFGRATQNNKPEKKKRIIKPLPCFIFLVHECCDTGSKKKGL